jgi:uncharacterized protein (DUF1786 family)
MRLLAIDVGTGTQDVLLFDDIEHQTLENAVQLVAPSPTRRVEAQIREATAAGRAVWLRGPIMGGGPCAWAASDHARAGLPIYADPGAAQTLDDDLDKVRAGGLTVLEPGNVPLVPCLEVRTGDLQLEEISAALSALGVEPRWDALAVAVFDHGAAPPQVSDRAFRFEHMRERVAAAGGDPLALTYPGGEVPADLTRLAAVASAARASGATRLLLADTAVAAVLGACEEPSVAAQVDLVICNVGNFHTLAVELQDGRVSAAFEHHTGLIDGARLGSLLERFCAGTLDDAEVFQDHGHGVMRLWPARTLHPTLVVVGPRRGMLDGLPWLHRINAAPYGDMMLAGCFGLRRAVLARGV